MKKRIKVYFALGFLISVGIVMCVMIPAKSPITVAFARYDDGETAVLVFTNTSADEVACFWQGDQWLKSDQYEISRRFPDGINRRATYLSPGVNELKIQRIATSSSNGSALKLMVELPPGKMRIKLRSVFRRIGFHRADLRNTHFVTVEIPATPGISTNAPAAAE